MITAIAADATQMKQAEQATNMAVAVAKKGQEVQKMMGEGAMKLIESASVNGDAAAKAQGKGSIINVVA
ncbi:MAG: hypothetical protein LBV04_01740 [Deferribacteraceae bacterium]|jgi:hypothetical protein|nr:hypothetical protein [Deferribacteraceae bacterium]